MMLILDSKMLLGGFLAAGMVMTGCGPKNVQTNAGTNLAAYVADAKEQKDVEAAGEGSLWVSRGRRSDLFRDFKARNVNDVVTIQVAETTQATSTADASNSRSSEMSAGIDGLIGIEKKVKELPKLVDAKSGSTFQGQGSTNRASTLQTRLTARVIDVLPNGYLVVEGVRELRVNHENQSVYLTGVVRPEDINSQNVVASSAVAQMTVRVEGKGVVSQPLKPGWLYKILNGILPF